MKFAVVRMTLGHKPLAPEWQFKEHIFPLVRWRDRKIIAYESHLYVWWLWWQFHWVRDWRLRVVP